ncbi:zinc-dependent metalloprotease [Flavipsychrobacter stenotrophus]|uniref:Zinc-dependent metalloprotease n=1 Tax=Flavipsychrobacter stenotrophus TaxID=2077091 RepID=A0A2S7T1L0_9BACT|nr:zinc-dependent metalloprotease [Flavipsychrobacter stenotrophus]PQJ12751.1 zinc-dependent metalloprotease [Flavipsychrobacter stenotrophus]
MKKYVIASLFVCIAVSAVAKKKHKGATPPPAAKSADSTASAAGSKKGPKPYDKVITDKAVTKKGLFNVHKVEDKWYFEIPDSLLKREMIVTTRYTKTAGGGGVYAGEMENQQTILWERGPNKNVLLRVVTVIGVADSTSDIYKAVTNSNLNPIAESFDIKAYGKDSSVVIDVSDYFKGDNQPISLGAYTKKRFNLGGQIGDRSYIQSINSYPINTEVRVVRTFGSTPSFGPSAPSPIPSTTFPAAYATGAVTLEMNNSFILLPKVPMARRSYDSRVGFFADDFVEFGDNQQKAENNVFICRWRLEAKDEDMVKWKNGELVEPKKPIVYYIDPATPKKWRPYLIAGINDWQKAFEQAGFKNAIMGKEWDPKDSTSNLEDARFSVLRYLPSEVANAYGPNVHDPRSGEIIESHIGWYHNVMKLVHDWYMIQAAAVDPKARKMEFDDELMGQLIRFVSSHEVGHTLGLRHNMGSSSRTPVEKLRDKDWVTAHGHTASIMDYARFNYVAQPEDNMPETNMFPRIGDYDKWAIQWGYKSSFAANEKEDQKITNKWIVDSLKVNPRLWFGTESNPFDPRSQTEDLGDNSMKASEYGLRNLKRIIVQLPEWTKEEADRYENLRDVYSALVGQYGRYMGHVLKNVGGVYETPKSIEQKDEEVYEPTPTAIQKEAVTFLNKQCFETPSWLLNKEILNKISNPVASESVSNVQVAILNNLLSVGRMNRMAVTSNRFGDKKTYTVDVMMEDLKKGVWSELTSHKPIDGLRRNLQKAYVDALIGIINPAPGQSPTLVRNNDAVSVARAQLVVLKTQSAAAANGMGDKMSKYHLQDIAARITKALDPKS